MKPKSSEILSRTQILAWINSHLNGHETKIQNLGTGVIYCLLINRFQPNTIPPNKINIMPKNQLDYQANLRKLQQALKQLNINNISFDIYKIAEKGYQENWQLITKLHKALIQYKSNKEQVRGESNKILQQTIMNENYGISTVQEHHYMNQNSFNSFQIVKTPMRTFHNSMSIKTDTNVDLKGHQGIQIVEKIKNILTQSDKTDRVKVRHLKNLLGLQCQRQDNDLNELLGDEKNNCNTIVID